MCVCVCVLNIHVKNQHCEKEGRRTARWVSRQQTSSVDVPSTLWELKVWIRAIRALKDLKGK